MVRMLLSSLTPCLCSIKEVEVLGFHCVFVSPSFFFFWGGGVILARAGLDLTV